MPTIHHDFDASLSIRHLMNPENRWLLFGAALFVVGLLSFDFLAMLAAVAVFYGIAAHLGWKILRW